MLSRPSTTALIVLAGCAVLTAAQTNDTEEEEEEEDYKASTALLICSNISLGIGALVFLMGGGPLIFDGAATCKMLGQVPRETATYIT